MLGRLGRQQMVDGQLQRRRCMGHELRPGRRKGGGPAAVRRKHIGCSAKGDAERAVGTPKYTCSSCPPLQAGFPLVKQGRRPTGVVQQLLSRGGVLGVAGQQVGDGGEGDGPPALPAAAQLPPQQLPRLC